MFCDEKVHTCFDDDVYLIQNMMMMKYICICHDDEAYFEDIHSKIKCISILSVKIVWHHLTVTGTI